MISIDKHPTFIGLINDCCSISTVKQIFISTFCLNGYTMVGTDLRLLYEAEDVSDHTGLLAKRARKFFAYNISFGPKDDIYFIIKDIIISIELNYN